MTMTTEADVTISLWGYKEDYIEPREYKLTFDNSDTWTASKHTG